MTPGGLPTGSAGPVGRAVCQGTVVPGCRFFVSDALCCDEEGLVTTGRSLSLELFCSVPTRVVPSCVFAHGPVNVTVKDSVVPNHATSSTFRFLVSWLRQGDYEGPLEVGFNASAPGCSMPIDPCVVGTTAYARIAARPSNVGVYVTSLDGFAALAPSAELSGTTWAIAGRESLAWAALDGSGCKTLPYAVVPPSFFQKASFLTYDDGVSSTCTGDNSTVVYNAGA